MTFLSLQCSLITRRAKGRGYAPVIFKCFPPDLGKQDSWSPGRIIQMTANLIELQKCCWWPPCESETTNSAQLHWPTWSFDNFNIFFACFSLMHSRWAFVILFLKRSMGFLAEWSVHCVFDKMNNQTQKAWHQKCCRQYFWFWGTNHVPNNIDGFAVQWENSPIQLSKQDAPKNKMESWTNPWRITN